MSEEINELFEYSDVDPALATADNDYSHADGGTTKQHSFFCCADVNWRPRKHATLFHGRASVCMAVRKFARKHLSQCYFSTDK